MRRRAYVDTDGTQRPWPAYQVRRLMVLITTPFHRHRPVHLEVFRFYRGATTLTLLNRFRDRGPHRPTLRLSWRRGVSDEVTLT